MAPGDLVRLLNTCTEVTMIFSFDGSLTDTFSSSRFLQSKVARTRKETFVYDWHSVSFWLPAPIQRWLEQRTTLNNV